MLSLTREVRFSVDTNARSEPRPDWANTWSGWPGTAGLAPFLCLRATLTGIPNMPTGYLCDIKDMDDLLQQHAVTLAGQMLREQGPELSATRLLQAIWQSLPVQPFPGAKLIALELRPSPYHYFKVRRDQPDMIEYTEQFEFSASHRLHCAELSDQQNRELFGKCNSPNGHGHNYVVEVTIAVAPGESEMPPRRRLSEVVKDRILDRFDHKHLNEDTVEFRQRNPTVENITQVVWDLLAGALPPRRLVAVRVYETAKTWAEIRV